jgi:histidine ammonia-lyase
VLSDKAKKDIVACREYLDKKMASQKAPIYGINTGFGSLCNVIIPDNELEQLQTNLVMSHACGMGDEVPVGNCSFNVTVKNSIFILRQKRCAIANRGTLN